MDDLVFDYLHCERKRRFPSKEKAQRFANHSNKVMGGKGSSKIAPYFCEVCNGWHNGHRQKNLGHVD